jgi:hypothetical protein
MSWPDVTVVDACVRRDGQGGSPTPVIDDDPAATDADRRGRCCGRHLARGVPRPGADAGRWLAGPVKAFVGVDRPIWSVAPCSRAGDPQESIV